MVAVAPDVEALDAVAPDVVALDVVALDAVHPALAVGARVALEGADAGEGVHLKRNKRAVTKKES